MLPALSCRIQSSPSINLCNDDAELKHDNQDNGDVMPDEDMAVELLSDSEYNLSFHDSSFMSVDEEFANTNINSLSVDMELVAPDSPPVLVMMERSVTAEVPSQPELPKAGPSTQGIRKTVVDIFNQTKHHAVDALVNTKRVLDDSDGSGDEKVKLKLHRKRPQKILNSKYSSNQTSCRLGPVGISKSAVVSCSLNQQCDDGTFIKDPSK